MAEPLETETTSELVDRSRRGDSQALEKLYRRLLPPLRGWARGRLPASARRLLETDDLVQNAMLRTLSKLEDFDPAHSGAFQAYLRKGVLNGIRDELRRRGPGPAGQTTVRRIRDLGPSPLEDALGKETVHRFERALERLSEEERELVVCRIQGGMGYREIAEACGKPSPDAARMAVSRALVKLAREMDA